MDRVEEELVAKLDQVESDFAALRTPESDFGKI